MWCLILDPVKISNLTYKKCLDKMRNYNCLPINDEIYNNLKNLSNLRLIIKKYFPDKDINELPDYKNNVNSINLDDKIELSKINTFIPMYDAIINRIVLQIKKVLILIYFINIIDIHSIFILIMKHYNY